MGNGALYMEDEEWLKKKMLKTLNIEKRGLWAERNYYIDEIYYYLGTQHLYVNDNRIANIQEISKFRDFMEEINK